MLVGKKALIGRQIVLLIIALIILGFILWQVFFSSEQSFDLVAQIKDFFYA